MRHTGVQPTSPHWGSRAQDLRVNLRAGISQESRLVASLENGKIDSPSHFPQSDSACAQEGFSDQEEMCYWPLALGEP